MRPVRIVVSIENEVGWICQCQRKRKDKRKEDQRQAERAENICIFRIGQLYVRLRTFVPEMVLRAASGQYAPLSMVAAGKDRRLFLRMAAEPRTYRLDDPSFFPSQPPAIIPLSHVA